MQGLKNKVAIVTGASRGIGFAIAEKFAEYGINVAICSRSGDQGAAHTLQSAGVTAKSYQVDVADAQQCESFIKDVIADFGSIDILVNNAGITQDNLLMRMKPAQWDAVISTNLSSAFHLSKAVIRPMMKNRGGRIINITSIIGLIGNAGQTNYAASKAGMIGLTKSLAKEVASRGITVNAIAPGYIQTDMTADLDPTIAEKLKQNIPLGALGESHHIADAALFFASDMASYITGQVLTVDGGLVM